MADAFTAFARSPDSAPLPPFETPVTVLLGPDGVDTRIVHDPRRAEAWQFDLGVTGFRGYEGIASPLELVAGDDAVRVAVGPQLSCVGSPSAVAPAYSHMHHISLLGIAGTGELCMDEFRVDLFLSDAGRITVVVLDLVDPWSSRLLASSS